jgi:hypothetical protein
LRGAVAELPDGDELRGRGRLRIVEGLEMARLRTHRERARGGLHGGDRALELAAPSASAVARLHAAEGGIHLARSGNERDAGGQEAGDRIRAIATIRARTVSLETNRFGAMERRIGGMARDRRGNDRHVPSGTCRGKSPARPRPNPRNSLSPVVFGDESAKWLIMRQCLPKAPAGRPNIHGRRCICAVHA